MVGPAPGGTAETPTQIPPRGWWQITRRAVKELEPCRAHVGFQ
ncbi:MAG TPA: hypothetical protein VFC19_29255 [Candidatus Limnocylindrales bacterium]|nr:hypothetical protein [Candidatus Limnocylindrales bacterium]